MLGPDPGSPAQGPAGLHAVRQHLAHDPVHVPVAQQVGRFHVIGAKRDVHMGRLQEGRQNVGHVIAVAADFEQGQQAQAQFLQPFLAVAQFVVVVDAGRDVGVGVAPFQERRMTLHRRAGI